MASKVATRKIERVRITGKTKVGKFQDIVQKIVIKDRIQRVYALCAREHVELRKFKRAHGYCGGSPSCMEITEAEPYCVKCRKAQKNPRYTKPVYEYGKIRAEERKQDKRKKLQEAEVEQQKKSAPRRRAA